MNLYKVLVASSIFGGRSYLCITNCTKVEIQIMKPFVQKWSINGAHVNGDGFTLEKGFTQRTQRCFC